MAVYLDLTCDNRDCKRFGNGNNFYASRADHCEACGTPFGEWSCEHPGGCACECGHFAPKQFCEPDCEYCTLATPRGGE